MKYLLQHLKGLKKKKDNLGKQCKRSLEMAVALIRTLEELGGDIRALSKEAINASVNDDFTKTREMLKEAGRKLEKFNKGLSKVRTHLGRLLQDSPVEIGEVQNIYSSITTLEKDFSAAREEFFEAKILHVYIKSNKGKILEPAQLELADFETYAGALSDFCGELLRKARLDIIKKSNCEKEIKKYLQDTKNIYQGLANFAFSGRSGIRPKVEALKKYILGFENLLYDLSKKSGN